MFGTHKANLLTFLLYTIIIHLKKTKSIQKNGKINSLDGSLPSHPNFHSLSE
jgi:hypothetical protein